MGWPDGADFDCAGNHCYSVCFNRACGAEFCADRFILAAVFGIYLHCGSDVSEILSAAEKISLIDVSTIGLQCIRSSVASFFCCSLCMEGDRD